MSGLFDERAGDAASGVPGDDAGRPDPLERLNDAQREAVTHTGGPLIVLAGPGTGKTRVIISRIAHMVGDLGVDPATVLALTFTNKAAGEMRERLAEALGPIAAEAVRAFTFNGFGAHALRRFSDLAGLPREPELIDTAQRRRIMREIVDTRGLFADAVASGLDGAIDSAVKLIGAMHARALDPASAMDRLRARRAEIEAGLAGGVSPEAEMGLLADSARADRLVDVVALWGAFEEACLERGLISYDDQLSRTNRLLAKSEMVRTILRSDHRHVVVDEFQDVNAAQIEMLRLLAPPGAGGTQGPDLCVVGDDDQAIYGFRGADDRAFEKFEKVWPGARTVMLEENYRSATPVLGAAASVIGKAHNRFREEKVVRRADGLGDDPTGSVVEAVRLENYRQAGEVIASMITSAVRTGEDIPLGSFAVIGRTWTELQRLRGALEVEGLPTRMDKGSAPIEDAGVLDVQAWIDLLLHPDHTWSARRILRRPPFQIGVGTVTALERGYRAAVSRDVDPGPFAEWAAERADEFMGGDGPDEAAERGRVERFAAVYAELHGRIGTMDAATAIAEIVRMTDVVHADLLDGRARAARVSAVVGLMRFAADRVGRLEAPGDLGAFVSYVDDLREGEEKLAFENEGEGVPGEDDGDDAVRLISAHRAKGLEFDTVFVPRVEPPHGYPMKNGNSDDDDELPAWLAGEPGTGLEGDEDEERRLFYVACTRAQRRLVLLGRVPKSSKSMNFLVELLDEPALVVDRTADEVLGAGAGDDVERELGPLGFGAMEKRREALRSARRLARLDAARALDAADRAGIDDAVLAASAERLAEAAGRLAAVAKAEAGEDLPDWLDGEGCRAAHASILAASEEGENVPATGVMRAMSSPLKLSYTAINQWEWCPRCFYVREVLGLPVPEGERIVVGQVVHGALERFYKAIRDADESGEERPHPSREQLLAWGDELFADAWGEGTEIDQNQRARVRAMLALCRDRFHDESINVEDAEKSFAFVFEHNGPHKITGKIDRLDITGGGYRIVDYKTGNARKGLVEPKKDDLQMGIYALALRAFVNGGEIDGHEPPAGTAEYWVLSSGDRGVISLDELAEKEDKTRERIGKAIDGMLAGEYPVGRQCSGACGVLEPGGVWEV